MDASRLGTACLIAAAVGFMALGTLAYGGGFRNGLAVPEVQKEEQEWERGMANAPLFLGMLWLLPLTLLVIGVGLHRSGHGYRGQG